MENGITSELHQVRYALRHAFFEGVIHGFRKGLKVGAALGVLATSLIWFLLTAFLG
jgi:hypothetical protein